MSRPRGRFLPFIAPSALAALAVAACGTVSATNPTSAGSRPIIVGATEPLSGAFAPDGHASLRGLELWASTVNTNGGLLGRPVQLKVLNDNSDPATVTRDYTQLITHDHVDLTVAPYSSKLTVPAAQVTEKYHYALADGSGGAPSVFKLNDPNVFGITTPVVNQMRPFAIWVLSLPLSRRPQTAAYPMVADPFADPPVQTAESILERGGVRTVYSNAAQPITAANLAPYADAVVASHPDMVVLGTVDIPSILAFIHEFEAKHFTPKIMIASSGPDQGQEFLNHVGKLNAEAIMVPNGWYGGEQNALSHVMVQDYIAKYGGTSSDINADVAEAYSSGEVLADAATGTHSLDQAKIIAYLHSHTMQTVQGPASFAMDGENPLSQAFIFQWQNGLYLQVLPNHAIGSPAIERIKPAWLGG